MSSKNFRSAIDSLMKTACDTAFTISVEQIIAFIKQVIECIYGELSSKGKKPVISPEEAYAKAEGVYLDEDGELSEEVEFLNDKDALTSIFDFLYTLLTDKDYKRESKVIVDNIKNDERFAYTFFYGNSLIPGRSIARIRSRIIYQMRKSYGIELSDADVATILYEHLYSEGTWKNLNSYSFQSTFFNWLSVSASHAIMKYLEELGLIKVNRERKPGNTRLVWKSKSPEYCAMMLDDMVQIPPIHAFLTALYVERKTKEEMQKEFDLDDKDFQKTLNASEKALKVALLNTEHCYDDFLVDKNARKATVSSEFLTIIGKTNAYEVSDSPLRDVLGVSADDPNFEEKVIDFLYDFTNKLFKDEQDRFIFQGRFIKGISPVDMGELVGHDRGWVDCKYNRLLKKFKAAAREWYNNITR